MDRSKHHTQTLSSEPSWIYFSQGIPGKLCLLGWHPHPVPRLLPANAFFLILWGGEIRYE